MHKDQLCPEFLHLLSSLSQICHCTEDHNKKNIWSRYSIRKIKFHKSIPSQVNWDSRETQNFPRRALYKNYWSQVITSRIMLYRISFQIDKSNIFCCIQKKKENNKAISTILNSLISYYVNNKVSSGPEGI